VALLAASAARWLVPSVLATDLPLIHYGPQSTGLVTSRAVPRQVRR